MFNEPFPSALDNDTTTSNQLAIVDTTTDAALIDGSHPILYTDSGELAHNCPETFTDTCTHKNRLWGIGADQRTIWYSQIYSDSVTPSFNELQTLTVDDSSEPLIAIESLYDKLLIFTGTRIYVVYGDGPSIAGTGNDLTTPQRIPSTSGCLDPRSVVPTPMGIMFQGIMGLMLVDTGLSVTFLGKNIVGALAPYPTCVAADWCEDSSTVRFAFTSNDAADESHSAAGVLALYDVRRQRWAVHSLSSTLVPGSANAPLAAATWHPELGYCTGVNVTFAAGAVTGREATLADAAPWLDYGTYFVPLSVTTAWIKDTDGNDQKLQGALRYRRVRVLGQFYEAHDLVVNIGYDYAIPSEAHTFGSATIAAFVVGAREQVRVTPQHGKAQAIQVKLTTAPPDVIPGTYTGRGAGFTGLQFEVHARKGGYRGIPAGAKS